VRGDSKRVARARHLIADYERRLRTLPIGLIGDQPVAMLLHLFMSSFDNERLSWQRLVARVRASPAVGERWIAALAAMELLRDDEGGHVSLTSDGLALLREYLSSPDGEEFYLSS
jgi:hypothetical protein